MSEGSLEARDRLPSALALCRLTPEHWGFISSLLLEPPLWMFVAWAPQMIAMLYNPHGAVVAQMLTRLATTYPQALYFPYQVRARACA